MRRSLVALALGVALAGCNAATFGQPPIVRSSPPPFVVATPTETLDDDWTPAPPDDDWTPEPEDTPEPGQVVGSDVENLLGRTVDDPTADAILHVLGCPMSASYIKPTSSGFECKIGGMTLGLDMGGSIAAVSMLEAGTEGFQRFEYAMPEGLAWGQSMTELEPALSSRYGDPARHWDPQDILYYYSDTYATSGRAYQTLYVEFSADSGLLEKVTIARDAP